MILRLTLLFLIFTAFAAPEEVTTGYIEQYSDIAVIEMHRTGVPASITLAQAILESNSGTSMLARQSNNHFGIKCKSYWNGGSYYHKDDDKNAYGELIPSCFRAYNEVLDSYIDHSNFLKFSAHYAPLFSLSRTDYEGWANGLKQCGYATDPSYAGKLIQTIKKYRLNEYDLESDPRTWLISRAN